MNRNSVNGNMISSEDDCRKKTDSSTERNAVNTNVCDIPLGNFNSDNFKRLCLEAEVCRDKPERGLPATDIS